MVRRFRGFVREPEKAYALLVVTVAIVVLLASGALLALHLQSRMFLLRDQYRNFHLQGLLDSGYSLASSILSEERLYTGTQVLELNGGEVEVVISVGSGQGWPSGTRRVLLFAKYRGEQRAAEGFILVDPPPGSEPKLFGIEPIPPDPDGADYFPMGPRP